MPRPAALAVLAACSALALPVTAQADSAIDLDIFRSTSCTSDQILSAMEAAAPDEWADLHDTKEHQRLFQQARSWIIRVLQASPANPDPELPSTRDRIIDQQRGVNDHNSGRGSVIWWIPFQPYADEIASTCDSYPSTVRRVGR